MGRNIKLLFKINSQIFNNISVILGLYGMITTTKPSSICTAFVVSDNGEIIIIVIAKY